MLKGTYNVFDNTKLSSLNNVVDALYASMSYPGWYEPAQVFGSSFVDGASVMDVEIASVINSCAA